MKQLYVLTILKSNLEQHLQPPKKASGVLKTEKTGFSFFVCFGDFSSKRIFLLKIVAKTKFWTPLQARRRRSVLAFLKF